MRVPLRLGAAALSLIWVGCGHQPDLSTSGATASGGSPDASEAPIGMGVGADASTAVLAPGVATCASAERLVANPFWSGPDGSNPVAQGGWNLGDLAVAGDQLYLVVNGQISGSIWRLPIRGGAPERVASTDGFSQALVLTASDLIWAESHVDAAYGTIGDIVAVPLAGGPPRTLASTEGAAVGLAVDPRYLYFSDASGTKRLPLAGGNAEALTPTTGQLAVYAGGLAIANSDASTISSVGNGGATTILATNQQLVATPVACADALCWITQVPGRATQGTGTLVRLATGAAPEPLSTSAALYVPYRLLFDSNAFYASISRDAAPGGPIERIPSTGGDPVTIPDTLTTGLAVDRQCLYWADAFRGVFTVAK